VIHLSSLADFDYYFLFVGWWQYAATKPRLSEGREEKN
jgi:hypothetical protein